jgi:uncharacterized membrane protein
MRRTRIGAMNQVMSKWCFTLLLLAGCPPEQIQNPTCDVKAVAECPSPAPTYVDVKPLFDTHCNVCHGVRDEIWPLDNYDDVSAWQLDIRGELLECTMPPADAGTGMTLEEKTQIITWIRCGLPH